MKLPNSALLLPLWLVHMPSVVAQSSTELLSVEVFRSVDAAAIGIPSSGTFREVVASNGGKASDIVCQSRTDRTTGAISCYIDRTSCNSPPPFPVEYELKFMDELSYYLKPGSGQVALQDCKWFRPADRKYRITYVYRQPARRGEAQTRAYLSSIDLEFEDSLPESTTVLSAQESLPNWSLSNPEYVAFVESSRELSAVYADLYRQLPDQYREQYGPELELKAMQYSAYTTSYANLSLKQTAELLAPGTTQDNVVVTGSLKDYLVNRDYVSSLLQTREQASLTQEGIAPILTDLRAVLAAEQLENSTFSAFMTINQSIEFSE